MEKMILKYILKLLLWYVEWDDKKVPQEEKPPPPPWWMEGNEG